MSRHGIRRSDPGARRSVILATVLAALVAGGLLDRVAASSPTIFNPGGEPVPVAAPAAALSSSWFCAGATDGGPVDAPGRVVIANAGPADLQGVVNVVSSAGRHRTVSVTVAPGSSTSVPETVAGGARWTGATVDMDGGAVAVSQVIDGRGGVSATPCATTGSSRWYFATGFTLVNAGVDVSLLNPYPQKSVVDLSFTTDQGQETPQDYQGLVVPGGGMLTVNLGDHLRRRHAIATTVSVRSGRVVAWQTTWAQPPAPGAALLGTPAAARPLADPAWPDPGVDVTLGAPSAATAWTWPDGMAGNGVDERYVIYNPGAQTAEVRLSLGLDQGVAEPFDLSVGPGDVIPVVSEQQARIPAGVAHSAVLVSTNGVPVIAVRMVSAGAASAFDGFGVLSGGRVSASTWLVPSARADRRHQGWIVLYNPGSTPVRASVTGLGSSANLPGVGFQIVGPGKRVAVRLGHGFKSFDQAVEVDATGPLYVESDVYGQDGTPGIGLALGVPLSP